MTKREQVQAEKRIERIYRVRCSGIPIDMFDIAKVFSEGLKAVKEGADDQVLGDRIAAFVETIRKDKAS